MTFLYFAYASNMLSRRIHINSPSALFKSIAELKNFKLSFSGYSNGWKGSPATIINSETDSVWGVLWELSKEHEENLTKQEVGYDSFTVTVETPAFGKVECKVFQKLKPECETHCLPSPFYKSIFVQGAIEHELPSWYVEKLEGIQDNGYKGPLDIPVIP